MSTFQEENQALRSQIELKDQQLKNYEQELKDWKRKVEKMRGNLTIYIRMKPILQSELDKINKVNSESDYRFNFDINNSNIKFVRQFKKFDNTLRSKEFNYKVDEILQDSKNNNDIFDLIREKINMIADGTNLSLIT